VRVLSDEKQGPFERAILGVEAAHEIGLGFDHVERQAIGFGEKRNKKDQGRDGHEKDKPHAAPKAGLSLHLDDARQAERGFTAGSVDPEENGQHGQGHGKLIGDELRGGANAADEGVLGVRGPAGKNHRIHTKGGDGEDGQDPQIAVGKHERTHDADRGIPVGSKGNYGHRRESGNEREKRGEDEVEFVNMPRDRILLEQELAAIGHEVKNAESLEKASKEGHSGKPGNNGAIGTGAILDPGRNLAFRHRARSGNRENHQNDSKSFKDASNKRGKAEVKVAHVTKIGGKRAQGWKWRLAPSGKGRCFHEEPSRSTPVSGRPA